MNADDFVEMLFRKTAGSKEMNDLVRRIYEENAQCYSYI